MIAISLFSGVGGFEIGFQRAGIETVLQAEQDAWCLRVLERHWPDTERVTDVRAVRAGVQLAERHGGSSPTRPPHSTGESTSGGVDLIYGGFPCQDLSVAGNRAGLGGERSGLWFEFERVLRELRPRWAVIENVPGLLSSGACPCDYCAIARERIASHRDESDDAPAHDCIECSAGLRLLKAHQADHSGDDFAIILDALVKLGYGVAWAVLDAQHFGVPQRRRRVFIVGGPGERAAQQVLSVCESCGGNPPEGRKTGQGVARAITSRAEALERDGQAGNLVAQPVIARPYADGAGDENRNLIADTVRSHPRPGSNTPGAVVVATLRGRESAPGVNMPGRGGEDDANLIAPTLSPGDARGLAGRRADQPGGAIISGGVRRLTPLECEHLMAWPDNFTKYAADGAVIADSHRYRMCGNSVVATVAEWIGHRLVAVDGAL